MRACCSANSWEGKWGSFGLVLTAVVLALSAACSPLGRTQAKFTGKKVIVLGIDGLEPQILDRLVQAGKLPNFAALAAEGDYRRLTTSIPPQSPVAWSNVITGLNPGGHGVFDFIHRDPATLVPYLSTSRVEPPKRTLKVGSWVLPLSGGEATLLREGKAFWEYLAERGIPATVFRMPANFPPVEAKARTFAGMGTPDILGTYGTFAFYTDEPPWNADEIAGGRVYRVEIADSKVEAELVGPPNSFRKDKPPVKVPFTVWLDPAAPVAKIAVQEQELLLQEGEWSEWVPVKFEFVPYLASVSSICRFYLKQVRPVFELYVSPFNLDPANPALPLSTPEDYAHELWEEVGYFHTLGIAEDTKALSAGIFTDAEYLAQGRAVLAENLKIFEREFARFDSGLFFFYFSSLDQNAHMFWRALDPKHPAYDADLAARYGQVLEEFYQEMDSVLGRVMERVDANTTLLVLSDHGFAPYYRSFNLNAWLLEQGYAALKDELQPRAEFLTNVDWSRTRAYGLGLNALYLNLRGREREGIVPPGADAEALLDELTVKLLALRDPETGQPVISRVDRASQVYSGAHLADAPDLVVGYNHGYRAGWGTVLGGFGGLVLEDNLEPWSGDHCMDYTQVPGVLLSNKKIGLDAPALTDLAPTILAEFSLAQPETMAGHSVFTPPAASPAQAKAGQ